MLTADEARRVWNYDPKTGRMYWLIDTHNQVEIGSEAGSINGAECCIIEHKGKSYKRSRLAWLICAGSWPPDQIDHINRDELDDRFCNLRAVTNAQNSQNKGKYNTKNQYKGVYPVTGSNRWRAQIKVGGKLTHLGTFVNQIDAYAAYCSAKNRINPFSASPPASP